MHDDFGPIVFIADPIADQSQNTTDFSFGIASILSLVPTVAVTDLTVFSTIESSKDVTWMVAVGDSHMGSEKARPITESVKMEIYAHPGSPSK